LPRCSGARAFDSLLVALSLSSKPTARGSAVTLLRLPRCGTAARRAPVLLLVPVSCDRQASGTLALALCVFLRRSGLELEADEPLIADHPRVVARLDDIRLARADLDLGAVLVLDRHPAGMDDPDVAGPGNSQFRRRA
jgi:hypothetical protein